MGENSGQPLRPQYRKMHFQKEWTEQTTTNDFVDLGDAWDKTGFQYGTIQIWNTGDTNDINYKILGSLNGTDYDIEIVSSTTLGEGATVLEDISSFSSAAYVPYVKIQVESAVDDSHSDVRAFGVCI